MSAVAKEPAKAGASRAPRSAANNYASTVATQSDVAKYRGKYKELKSKVKEMEAENDIIALKTLNCKRTIQRLRLERAILYERLEATGHTGEEVPVDTSYTFPSASSAAPGPSSASARRPSDQAMHSVEQAADITAPVAIDRGEEMDIDETAAGSTGEVPLPLPTTTLSAEVPTTAIATAASPPAPHGSPGGSKNGAMKVTLRRSGA